MTFGCTTFPYFFSKTLAEGIAGSGKRTIFTRMSCGRPSAESGSEQYSQHPDLNSGEASSPGEGECRFPADPSHSQRLSSYGALILARLDGSLKKVPPKRAARSTRVSMTGRRGSRSRRTGRGDVGPAAALIEHVGFVDILEYTG